MVNHYQTIYNKVRANVLYFSIVEKGHEMNQQEQ